MNFKIDSLKALVSVLLVLILIFCFCGKNPSGSEVNSNRNTKIEPATARLVFLAQGENDSTHVCIIDDSGENLKKLYSHSGRIGDIQVNPQGDKAVLFFDLGDPPPICNNQLFAIALESKQAIQLTDIPTGVCWEPQWILNSSDICFVFDSYPTRMQIYAIQSDGTAMRRITTNESVSHRLPRVSPDGQKIVFEKRLTPHKIAVIDADGSSEKIFIDTPTEDSSPKWSSNGEKILFIGDSKLCVMDSSGENYRVLYSAHENLQPFSVSPQSNVIVFNSYSGINRINIDGSGLELLTTERAQGHPILWSADESKIAFRTDLDNDDRQELCTINADGSNFRQVTPVGVSVINVSNYKAFDWAPLQD
jgi:Tol biopolymer transport system component